MQKNAAIVLLNYNSLQLLQQFLPTLIKYSPNWATIYIIDNNSSDQSKKYVLSNYSAIRWIQLKENYGFAGGYSKGLQQINEPYYILVNTDIKVTENWLEPLISQLKDNENLAAVQPKIKSYHEKNKFEHAGAAGGFVDLFGYPFCRGRIFDTVEIDEEQYNSEIKCFWASGACMAIKKEAYHKSGGFDDRFFMHMEEIDLCWRLQQLGYTIGCEPKSTVFHVGGGSLPYQHPKKMYYNFRNSLIMCFKNWTTTELLWKLPLRLALDKIAFVKELLTGNFQNAFAILKAILHFWLHIFTWKSQYTVKKKFQVKQIYSHSIVWQYFIKNRKTYQTLK